MCNGAHDFKRSRPSFLFIGHHGVGSDDHLRTRPHNRLRASGEGVYVLGGQLRPELDLPTPLLDRDCGGAEDDAAAANLQKRTLCGRNEKESGDRKEEIRLKKRFS